MIIFFSETITKELEDTIFKKKSRITIVYKIYKVENKVFIYFYFFSQNN